MPITKLTIQQFLQQAQNTPVFDVRSPGEYNHAHIPNAITLPLFTDEERKEVGTAYKQKSRQQAIKIGLDYFGPKMRKLVEEVEKKIGNLQLEISKNEKLNNNEQPLPIANYILLYCWRGGMRSAAVAWLLDMYGFKVYTLIGGYKSYRTWVLEQFNLPYQFNIIAGFTGSGKTLLLNELKKQNKPTINLEELANHKGSAFGYMGNQPSQEMFENFLAERLFVESCSLVEKQPYNTDNDQPPTTNIYIEDESQRIGNIKIPNAIWANMRQSKVLFLDIEFKERLKHIINEYGKLDKQIIVDNIERIKKRLGSLEAKNATNHALEGNIEACFRILLTYYDKWYLKGLNNRENLAFTLNKIPCLSVDAVENVKQIIACSV
jgi:tRNA 2-selenouridine synthase